MEKETEMIPGLRGLRGTGSRTDVSCCPPAILLLPVPWRAIDN